MARTYLSNLENVGGNPGRKGRKRKPKNELALSTRLAREYAQRTKGVKVGTGKRFDIMEETLAKKPGVKNPGALAAWIGEREYGKARFQKMAAAGRKRKR